METALSAIKSPICKWRREITNLDRSLFTVPTFFVFAQRKRKCMPCKNLNGAKTQKIVRFVEAEEKVQRCNRLIYQCVFFFLTPFFRVQAHMQRKSLRWQTQAKKSIEQSHRNALQNLLQRVKISIFFSFFFLQSRRRLLRHSSFSTQFVTLLSISSTHRAARMKQLLH